MPDRIWLSSPHMSDENFESKYIKEAFESNWIAPLGPNVDSFEKEISDLVKVKSALSTISGTAALHLALKALGVKNGDKVLCQSLTFSATANAILYENAIPVFIDSEKETWNLDPELLKRAIKDFPEAKILIVVHIYGNSAKMDEILNICNEHNIRVIEDAAESLGTKYKSEYTGTLGDIGIYSFNGNKIITTSGGGMLVSNNKNYIEKSKYWATQSREKVKHYEHKDIGYNYRMSNVLAGIGRGQLKILSERVKKKNYIYEYYKNQLNELKEIGFMPENSWDSPNRWLSVILTNGYISPQRIIDKLEENNIESRPVWKPMHMQPFFSSYPFFGNNTSEQLYRNGICLPSDTKIKDEELQRVCNFIREEWRK